MKRGSGPIIGDIVTLPEYIEMKNDFSLGDTKYSFVTRRIETVQKMKINGRELGASTQERVLILSWDQFWLSRLKTSFYMM